jgi:hypothetical protein
MVVAMRWRASYISTSDIGRIASGVAGTFCFLARRH